MVYIRSVRVRMQISGRLPVSLDDVLNVRTPTNVVKRKGLLKVQHASRRCLIWHSIVTSGSLLGAARVPEDSIFYYALVASFQEILTSIGTNCRVKLG